MQAKRVQWFDFNVTTMNTEQGITKKRGIGINSQIIFKTKKR